MDKKKLYEQIMASVAKEVKKALNEGEYWTEEDEEEAHERAEDVADEYLKNQIHNMVNDYTLDELLADWNGELEDEYDHRSIPDRIADYILDNYQEPRRWDVYDYVTNYIESVLKENDML